MVFLARLLIGGIRWVRGKVSAAVEAELDDDGALRQELLAAQMQLELGQISEEEFAGQERAILERFHEVLERRQGGPAGPHAYSFIGGTVVVEGFVGHSEMEAAGPPAPPSPRE